MSILDKVIAAVVPEPTPEARTKVRAEARALSGGSGWLAQVLDHHEQIDTAFEAVRTASSPTSRRAAQKWLGTLLTGHSIAEEAVLYPAMALGDHKAHSAEAYTEQSGAKVQTAGLMNWSPCRRTISTNWSTCALQSRCTYIGRKVTGSLSFAKAENLLAKQNCLVATKRSSRATWDRKALPCR